MKKILPCAITIFALLVMIGCSDSSQPAETSQNETGSSEKEKEQNQDTGIEAVDSAGKNWATIKGRVVLSGDPPRGSKHGIPSSHQQTCDLPSKLEIQRFDVDSETNGVKDVIVFVEDVKKKITSEMPPEVVTIDQKNCRFHPSDTFLVRKGGTAKVLNSDPTLHNFRYNAENVMGMSGNKNQPAEGDPIQVDFKQTAFVNFKCNIHPWMSGMLRTADHHAYAKTDKKGTFSFKVPAGSYTLKLRHIGMKKPQTLELEVKEGETLEKEFTLNSSP